MLSEIVFIFSVEFVHSSKGRNLLKNTLTYLLSMTLGFLRKSLRSHVKVVAPSACRVTMLFSYVSLMPKSFPVWRPVIKVASEAVTAKKHLQL